MRHVFLDVPNPVWPDRAAHSGHVTADWPLETRTAAESWPALTFDVRL